MRLFFVYTGSGQDYTASIADLASPVVTAAFPSRTEAVAYAAAINGPAVVAEREFVLPPGGDGNNLMAYADKYPGAPVPPPSPPETIAGAVAITDNSAGSLVEGTVLTADLTSITSAALPDGFTYQFRWGRRDDPGDPFLEILGATGNTYTVVEDDVGHSLAVAVSISGYTAELISPAAGPVA
jgi:hypothetical protein